MIKRLIKLVLLAGAAAVLVSSIPDIARYPKISTM
jgi:hypothetical protein